MDIQFIPDAPEPPYMRDLHPSATFVSGRTEVVEASKTSQFPALQTGMYQVQAEKFLPRATGSPAAGRDRSAVYKWNPSRRGDTGWSSWEIREHPVPRAGHASYVSDPLAPGERGSRCPRGYRIASGREERLLAAARAKLVCRYLRTGPFQTRRKPPFSLLPAADLSSYSGHLKIGLNNNLHARKRNTQTT